MYLVKLPSCRISGYPPVYGETDFFVQGPDMDDPRCSDTYHVYFYDHYFKEWVGNFFTLTSIELVGVLT